MDAVNPNTKCNVCGEDEFEEREGFYYCMECGTKHEHVRQIEVETGDAFNDTAGTRQTTRTMKIRTVKAEKPKPTSWECYNYILRGYVEELLAFGAKEELKLMALQIWAAYLRRMEVAFFSKKQAELPKLGVRYFRSDAVTIYNHSIARKKKRKRPDEASCTSGGEEFSARSWRKSMRKLDESLYSSSVTATSTSANSNKAIKLAYNMKARKILKRRMPAKHLLRHEKDTEGILECHNQPKVKELNRGEHRVMVMSLKQVYTVLAIALNLIGDDLQLSDLLRFINEGHIGWKNVLKYFPENITCDGKEILKRIEFYKFPEKYSDKFLRNYIGIFSKTTCIRNFKTPNIIALVQRYVTELCLPPEIRIYAERLINFLPPRFAARSECFYPAYEARAMAYIIFVLKLLFGLDGHKEYLMSKAAKKLNSKIQQMNVKNAENRPPLFVWDEWVQYIEMRKVIVSYFNTAFCKQFNQCKSTTQILEQMSEEMRQREEQEQLLSDNLDNNLSSKQKMDSFKALFETFLEDYKQKNQTTSIQPQPTVHIDFKPTYTPGLTYFKNILVHCDKTDSPHVAFKIPDFMRTDHTERDMQSYVEVKPLIEYFQNNQKELKVKSLDTTENRHYIGIFRSPRSMFYYQKRQKACFDITDENWTKKIATDPMGNSDVLDWKTDLDSYTERTIQKKMLLQRRAYDRINELKEQKEKHNSDAVITICELTKGNIEIRTAYSRNNTDPYPERSIDIFNENNMDPLHTDNALIEPRRNLGKVNIFLDIEDEDYLINDNETSSNQSIANDTFSSRSSESPFQQDYVSGIEIKSEFIAETSNEDQQPLKFYISNMDCWMIFGNILALTKPQLCQLQEKLPSSLSWLVETCAQTIGVEWSAVYEQLLVIELMLCIGIDDIDKVTDCVYLDYHNAIKAHQFILASYREIW